MGSIRKNYSAAFKAKVALSALQEKLTLEELSSKYQVSPKTDPALEERSKR